MKEKEFMKKYGISIQVPIYYTINKCGDVDIIDEEGMQDVFNRHLNKIIKNINTMGGIKK